MTEEMREYHRKYRAEHREKLRKYKSEWNKKNYDKVKKYYYNYLTRKEQEAQQNDSE